MAQKKCGRCGWGAPAVTTTSGGTVYVECPHCGWNETIQPAPPAPKPKPKPKPKG